MRTTVFIPDDLFKQAQPFATGKSFSQLVREALERHVNRLREEKLAREMEEGYRREAESPSLDPAWSEIETEDWL